ncbi:TPA: glycosyltransferase family 2 protein, partial [Streptococcus suis]
INSFCRQTDDNINVKIIVVDNSSPNESFDVLQNEFKDNLNISVVKTPKNLGFANGNNYGYNVLKEYMDPDFVIFSNSDIILPENGLYKWILQCKNDYNFGVLGPSIYSINGDFYQNPIRSL